MAKKPNHLTIDYKQLLKLTVSDRVSFAQTADGQSYLASLTPAQLAALFPSYYKKNLPDLGGAMSGGGAPAGARSGGAAPSATPSGGAAPAGGGQQPSTTRPAASSNAQKNTFLDHIRKLSPQQQASGGTAPGVGTRTDIPMPAGTGISAGLAKLRMGSFGDEIKDPKVLRQLAALEKVEVGSMSEKSKLDFIETLVNRAAVSNGSLMSRLQGRNAPYWGGGIGDPNKVTDKELEAFRQRLRTVVETGRDETQGATDNASNQRGNPLADRRAAKLAKEGRSEQGRWTGGERNSGEYVYVDTPYAKRSTEYRERALREARQISATGVPQQDPSRTGSAGITDLRPQDVSKDNSKDVVAQAARGDKTIGTRVLDRALQLEGMHERRDRETIQKYLKNGGRGVNPATTAWCADFVNATLGQEGIKGTKSEVATSFSEWGVSVGDPNKVRSGDVLVEHRGRRPGQTGGHVGLATGQTRINKRTGQLEIEMYGGNQGDSTGEPTTANKKWISADKLYIRRSHEAIEEEKSGIKPQAQKIEAVKPNNYSDWPEGLRKHIESMPPSEQKEIFDAHSKGTNIIDAWNTWSKDNPNPTPQQTDQAAEGIVKAVQNAPPGEAPKLPYTNTEADLQGEPIKATPYTRVVTNISGYSPGAARPKAAGPGKVQSTSEELQILKSGIDDRGPTLGYHAAVASFYYNRETGQKIDETSYRKLPSTQKDQYIERAEVHQLRNPSKRVRSMAGVDSEGVPWNERTYAVVRVGKMSPEKIRAYEDHLAEKFARGEIPEQALRNIHGDGGLRPDKRGHLEKETGGEGVADAKSISKDRIFARAEQIRKELQAAQGTATPQQPNAAPTAGPQQAPVQRDQAVSGATAPVVPRQEQSTGSMATTGLTPVSNAPPQPQQPQPTATPVPKEDKSVWQKTKEFFGGGETKKEDQIPEFEDGGAMPVGTADNATVVSDTGEAMARVNTNENITFKNGMMDVTPAHRTDPNDLQQRIETQTAQQTDRADTVTDQNNVQGNTGGMTSVPPQGNQNWAGDKNIMTQSSSAENFHQTASAARAYDLATKFSSNPVLHYGGFSTTTRPTG